MSNFFIKEIPDLTTFVKYNEKEGLEFDDKTTTNLIHADFYQKEINNRLVSVGVFSYAGKEIFCAWGYKDEVHCAMHSVKNKDGKWITPQEGCPIKIALKDQHTNIGLRLSTKEGDFDFIFR